MNKLSENNFYSGIECKYEAAVEADDYKKTILAWVSKKMTTIKDAGIMLLKLETDYEEWYLWMVFNGHQPG